MIDTRNDNSEHSFETEGDFLAPSAPEQDVIWLNQKEVRASVTESFPNGYNLSKQTNAANVAHRGSKIMDLANRPVESFSDRNPIDVYLAEVPLGKEIEEMRRAA